MGERTLHPCNGIRIKSLKVLWDPDSSYVRARWKVFVYFIYLNVKFRDCPSCSQNDCGWRTVLCCDFIQPCWNINPKDCAWRASMTDEILKRSWGMWLLSLRVPQTFWLCGPVGVGGRDGSVWAAGTFGHAHTCLPAAHASGDVCELPPPFPWPSGGLQLGMDWGPPLYATHKEDSTKSFALNNKINPNDGQISLFI